MRQQEQTSWAYEFGVRRPDGTIMVSKNGRPWDRQQAESWREHYDKAAKTLGQEPTARVVRRKVHTTTTVRREPWERGDQG